MKIALAQINQIVGDFQGNLKRIDAAISNASAKGARLSVFPEMATCGCYAMDLLRQDRFISDNLDLLDRIAAGTRAIGVVIGYIRPSPTGQRLENAAALISDGEIVSTHVKMRLSTHGDVEESTYFAPGESAKTVEFEGVRFGITLCDDICNRHLAAMAESPRVNPAAEVVQRGAEVILNLSAHPFSAVDNCERQRVLIECATDHQRPVVHVNMVGGSGEWVFDGGSMVIDTNGDTIAAAPPFKESVVVTDIESDETSQTQLYEDDVEALISALTLGTRDFIRNQGMSRPVVLLDGTLASSVAAVIVAEAVGARQMMAVTLVSESEKGEIARASESLANALGAPFRIYEIDEWMSRVDQEVARFLTHTIAENTDTLKPTKTVARRMLLQTLSQPGGGLLINTDTRSQLFMTAPTPPVGGFAVFKNVSMSRLLEMAALLRRKRTLPPDVLQTRDADRFCRFFEMGKEMALPYKTIDTIIDLYINHGYSHHALFSSGFDETLVRRIVGRIQQHAYYRLRLPPGIRISGGKVDRIPVDHRWMRF
jgi:NAD+ synthase (glutamine-hydrolysing)